MPDLTPKLAPHILLTRHESKNAWLNSALVNMGHSVSELQLLTMRSVQSAQSRFTFLLENQTYTDVVFVSPAAVEFSSHFLRFDDFKQVKFFAVGKGTADSLLQSSNNISNIIYPEDGAGAEALLDLPEMENLIDRRFLVVTGEDGKSLLAEKLLLGSAKVDVLECYRRTKSDGLKSKLLIILNDDISHVFLHSKHAAEYFLESWESMNQEERTMPKLILGADSIKSVFSDSKYFKDIVIADSPINNDMLLAFKNTT